MKKSLSLLFTLLLFASTLFAQKPFEGRIVFEVDLTGENADQMAAFMPSAYVYLISGSKLKFSMEGGMTAAMMGEIVVDGEEGMAYMVKHSEKTAYKMPNSEEEDTVATPVPEVEHLDGMAEVAGYFCRKYKVTSQSEEGETQVQYMWVTKAITLKKPKTGSAAGAGQVFVEGLDGFPLKIQTEVMGLTMIMTATTIEEGPVDAKEFEIPREYEVKDFDPGKF